MFNVSINGRFLTRPATGVDRFASELLRAWLPQRSRNSVKILAPSNYLESATQGFDVPLEAKGKFEGHVWEQFELPTRCGSDVLLNLCNTGPALHRRQVAVLHDAAFIATPGVYSFAFRNWYRALFAALMRRAAVIATVSAFSASELMRLIGGRAGNIEIIPESGEHVLRAAPDRNILTRLGLANQKYVLAVGSRTPNKNFAGVLRAAELLKDLDVKFVAAGGVNGKVFADVDLSGENLVLPGYVSDGELRALYESAQCFVFPSFYEGFGLPPLEAMHCGCPVVVSRRAALPEVCGEAAAYCNPEDPSDIAVQLRRVLSSECLRSELREAGFARARSFTWKRAAMQLEGILVGNFSGARA